MGRSSDSLHIVHWGRRTARALWAAAAVWLTACGGGGGSIPSAAEPPSTPSVVDTSLSTVCLSPLAAMSSGTGGSNAKGYQEASCSPWNVANEETEK